MRLKKFAVWALSVLLTLGTFALPEVTHAAASTLAYGSLVFGCVSGPQNGAVVPPTTATFANCSATVYLHGTSTLAGIYSNATGTAAANPLAAGANNQTVTFYTADGAYDVCVSNANSTPVLQSSCNYNIVVLTGNYQSNKVTLLSDFTDANASGLQVITGLAFAFPATDAGTHNFHCNLMYSQATGATADTFGVAALTTAATRIDAMGTVFTSQTITTTSGVAQNLANLTTTTPTTVVTFTPAATATVYNGYLDGAIQLSAIGASTLQFYVSQGTAANVITLKAGSYCTLL